MKKPGILVVCEFSGIVSAAFRDAGCEAYSCDILPTEGDPQWHIQGDALEALRSRKWALVIGFPPCTYLANSGVRWLYRQGTRERVEARWQSMREGAAFFAALWNAPVARLCLENPVMHGHARAEIERLACIAKPSFIHPHWFGHGETKSTGLYLRNLPPLQPTEIVSGRTPRVHHASPGPDRWKERSRTLGGVARAMATQWSPLLFP